jgi:sugar lactone lactonase YvrE
MKRNYFLLYSLFFLGIGVANAQIISTIAGNGSQGYSGDGGQATAAELYNPYGIKVDAFNNIYFADDLNAVIRKISSSGIINTIAGNGTQGYSGDGGLATAAEFNNPNGIGIDTLGNIYIADYYNQRIRKVTSAGIITTFAGNGVVGYSGDGGQATSAEFHSPQGIGVDKSGNVYIGDAFNNCIRKVNTAGIITTFAGNAIQGFSGDGGAASVAEINVPSGVAIDASGNVYFADEHNNRVREVNTSGIISTICGNGVAGYSGDGAQATDAELNDLYDVSVDASGNIYIADGSNFVIRKVTASTGIITTIAGNGTSGFAGDGGQSTVAELSFPNGLALDDIGNIYISDGNNNRIRKVTAPIVACTPDITTGLVAEYIFSGNANDVSGNGNNGTVYGCSLVSDRFGNPNSAYSFNGISDSIVVPTTASLTFSTSNAMSISFWAIMDTTTLSGYSQVMVSKQSGSGNSQTGYDIEEYGGSSFYNGLRVGTSGGPYGGGSTTTTPSLYQWHHYVFTYDGLGGLSTGYVDGILEDSVGGNTAVIGSDTYNLLFGAANWSNVNAAPFYGVLDDIYMYDRLLSSCDVDSLYTMPNTTTSVNEITAKNNRITIYPNPTNGFFNLELSGVTNLKNNEIEIYNVFGEKVYSSNIISPLTTLNLDVPNGVYFLKLKNEQRTVTQKIIINK